MLSTRCPVFASIALALVVAGCATGGNYPSLALRPIEDVSLAEPVARSAALPTNAVVADARYVAIVADARAADIRFRQLLEAERPTLQRGHDAAVGSDAWAAAQQIVSRLQAARRPVSAAVASLDTASEAPDTQTDRGYADAAARAAKSVREIDADEARLLAAATPSRS